MCVVTDGTPLSGCSEPPMRNCFATMTAIHALLTGTMVLLSFAMLSLL